MPAVAVCLCSRATQIIDHSHISAKKRKEIAEVSHTLEYQALSVVASQKDFTPEGEKTEAANN